MTISNVLGDLVMKGVVYVVVGEDNKHPGVYILLGVCASVVQANSIARANAKEFKMIKTVPMRADSFEQEWGRPISRVQKTPSK
jgi:hypothetical protein